MIVRTRIGCLTLRTNRGEAVDEWVGTARIGKAIKSSIRFAPDKHMAVAVHSDPIDEVMAGCAELLKPGLIAIGIVP